MEEDEFVSPIIDAFDLKTFALGFNTGNVVVVVINGLELPLCNDDAAAAFLILISIAPNSCTDTDLGCLLFAFTLLSTTPSDIALLLFNSNKLIGRFSLCLTVNKNRVEL